ncbi:PD-(D/E)XK nuclease family protein [Flavobacterium sp.]|uniref:PD-(D/E)XK nuclease family protein n=1 Tax=Flavobacterium sp. TaxID=239 RepID=UPI0035B01CC9
MSDNFSLELPSFFKSKDENKLDLGYENLQDFFLSWTLRCAEENYNSVNPILQDYAKKILFKLIFDNPNANYFVKEVKAWRQVNQIDLLLEVYLLDNNNKSHNYVLNIENKWYTNISDTQLIKYSEYIKSEYSNSDFIVKNIVIFCDSEKLKDGSNIQKAMISNYSITTVEDLKDVIGKLKTENHLFDEYWFKFYS